MPRTARAAKGGVCYHVINRGNARATVFHDNHDYHSFLTLIGQAQARIPMQMMAACLMPNHFHMILRPAADDDLGRWMQWLLTTHVRRHHLRYRTSGRIWQGRFKAFPVQQDSYLLNVIRYVERNALRAKMVPKAEDWQWGSLRWRLSGVAPISLADPLVDLPDNWAHFVNVIESPGDLETLRRSVNKGQPYGDVSWVQATAEELGLESSLRGSGRPRKERKN